MTGESYAGKYLPVFSNALLDVTDTTFNLMGTIMGDPYTSPVIQRTNVWKVPYALNIIDDSNMPQIDTMIRHCKENVNINITLAADLCSNIIDYIE